MFQKKGKNSKSNLITGLIVGGAIASVTTMMLAKKKKETLPEGIEKIEQPLRFWKKLALALYRIIKRFIKKG